MASVFGYGLLLVLRVGVVRGKENWKIAGVRRQVEGVGQEERTTRKPELMIVWKEKYYWNNCSQKSHTNRKISALQLVTCKGKEGEKEYVQYFKTGSNSCRTRKRSSEILGYRWKKFQNQVSCLVNMHADLRMEVHQRDRSKFAAHFSNEAKTLMIFLLQPPIEHDV